MRRNPNQRKKNQRKKQKRNMMRRNLNNMLIQLKLHQKQKRKNIDETG